jgi:hypothetical protein
VLTYFILINLPLAIFTFDTTNWSDDYQLTNLFAVKSKFSPILNLILDTTGGHAQGGHFAPVYNLINLLITSITVNPAFFHLIIMICYILTVFMIFLLVAKFYGDKLLGLIAGTLFAINYYVSFKALGWNTFHSHATNVFTGIISLYFFIRYLQKKKKLFMLFCLVFFLLTIFNYESGFVFFPLLILFAFFSLLKKQISFKKLILIILVISATMALFPIAAYLNTGKTIPLSYRFDTTSPAWRRSIQNYAFNANELFIKSTGLAILYNKLIFDNLKENPQLKEMVIQLVRENKKFNFKNLPIKTIFLLSMLGIVTTMFFIFIMVIILIRIRRQTRLFAVIYGSLFLIYLFIFYRTDVANAIAIFSSIIIADLVISFLRDRKKSYHKIGIGILGLYFILTLWTIFDRFDDCYRKSFFGLSKVAIHGPDKIYNEINKKIGRYAENGIILFTHDYSLYHHTGGIERIGDMIGIGDFVCLNAAVYYQDLMKTDIPKKYRHKTFGEFFSEFQSNPNYKKVVVSSIDDAFRYLRVNRIDTNKVEVIYVAEDYKVTKLK